MVREESRVIAGRAVVARWLSEEVRTLVTGVRNVLEPQMEPGERVTAQLPDGTVIGAVTIGKAAESASVTDQRALLAWVKEHAPTEIVESVNPAYVDALKKRCKATGLAYDDVTGGIIPGIELVTGSSSYRPAVDPTQVPLLRRRIGELLSNGLLELPASDESKAS
jgi:hypothetical protein